jgi:hypothetical protein
MRLRSPLVCCTVAFVLASVPCAVRAQQSALPVESAAVLPEAPQPALGLDEIRADQGQAQNPAPGSNPQTQAPSAGSSSSQPQDPPAQTEPQNQPMTEEQRRQKAEEQIKQQEKQRVLGIVPMFNTTYQRDAVSLTSGQKMKLAFRSAIDPVTIASAGIVAGIAELNADPNNSGFGWGAGGYMKRWGASYLDSFNGTMIGNGILPSVLHQDPRYFRLGRGSNTHRLFYAMFTTVAARHDVSRRWEPNYSNIGGNLIAGAISNLYYPATNTSNWEQTIASGLVVTAQGTVGAVFNEFWPDISRKMFHKDPTHGLDAQMRAEDEAAKQQGDQEKKEQEQRKQPLPQAPK